MKDNILIGVIAVLAILLMVSTFTAAFHNMQPMSMRRMHFVQMKDSMIQDMIPEHQYRCCLEKPCTYCIEKTPGHGEGASCDCLSDVVNGRHPCGECIGEILEGHGNPYLKEYFAEAIAEETGEKEAIQIIIDEKYPDIKE
ncbi:MAG: hypothetical protein ACE5FT_03695 [Candidatus Nanoarchaeia archaeon]